jgi:hypothetical protein
MSDLPGEPDHLADTSYFIKITDKLVSSLNSEDMKEKSLFENRKISERFNLINSKHGASDQETTSGKREHPKKEKNRSSTQKGSNVLSVSLIEREKQRDMDLQLKLHQLSLKQSARIKEIHEQEER